MMHCGAARSIARTGCSTIQPVRHHAPTRTCRSVVVRGYSFGGWTKRVLENIQEGLDRAGKAVTGDQHYQFGDLTQKAVKSVFDQANEKTLQLRDFSEDNLQKLKQFRFENVKDDLLSHPWGQQIINQAQQAGRTVSGKSDYELGDFSREIMEKVSSAQDRSSKMIFLPNDVEPLKQIVLEQQVLINSLVEKGGSETDAKELLQLIENRSVDELKPWILDQQEVLDDLMSSSEQHVKQHAKETVKETVHETA